MDAPLKHKWDSDLAFKFYAGSDKNVKLYTAIDSISFRAKMALAGCLCEWGLARFVKHAELTDAWFRLDAASIAVVHPLYAKNLELEMIDGIDDAQPMQGAIETILVILGETHERFSKGSIYLAEYIVNQAELVRYLTNKNKKFDQWLSEALKQGFEAYPRDADYDFDTEVFDFSAEEPVSRKFFDPEFNFDKDAARSALRGDLAAAASSRNPYLRSALELQQMELKEEPYVL